MTIIENRLKIPYKLLMVLITIFGLYISGGFSLNGMLYYTILSNILCAGYFTFNIYQILNGYEVNYHIKGAVTFAITVTMLVYWLVLAPQGFAMDLSAAFIGNMCVHLIVPLLVIGDWLLFDKKPGFFKYDPVKWLIIPLIYYVFAIIVSSFGAFFPSGQRYAYFFIDPYVIGLPNVLRNLLLLIVAFLGLGYILYFMDKLLGKWSKSSEKKFQDKN